MAIQLDFFQAQSDIEILEDKIKVLEKSLDKQRKALFARHGELSKNYIEINNRMDILERNLCKGVSFNEKRVEI